MRRCAGLAAASVMSVLLITACSATAVRSHDMLICQRLAVGMHSGVGSSDLFGRALTLGRESAHRRGYLSANLAKDLLATDTCNYARPARRLAADCRAVGIDGPVFPPMEPISC